MEAAVLSPSPAPAKELTADEARADLLSLFSRFKHIGGELAPDAKSMVATWCACCGAQYLNAEGKVLTYHLGWVPPLLEDSEELRELCVKKRASNEVGRICARKNKPGMTFAFMDKEKAIELLYDEQHRPFADGYNIDDEDQGYVCSVVWLNK